MTDVTTELLDDIDAKARVATAGPWIVVAQDVMGMDEQGRLRELVAESPRYDRHYIAATDPPTVLALTAEIRRYRAVLKEIYQWGTSVPRGMSEVQFNQSVIRQIKERALEEYGDD